MRGHGTGDMGQAGLEMLDIQARSSYGGRAFLFERTFERLDKTNSRTKVDCVIFCACASAVIDAGNGEMVSFSVSRKRDKPFIAFPRFVVV